MLAPYSPLYHFIGGKLIPYQDNLHTLIEKGYNLNDIVYSIVKLIMEKCAVAPWSIYTIEDEQAYKSLQGIMRKTQWSGRDYALAKDLFHKALKPAINAGKWGDLVKYPNDQYDFTDYIIGGIGYLLLTGNDYSWANMISGGANKGVPGELWTMPAQHVNIWVNNEFPTRVLKYNVALWPTVDYDKAEVCHTKYWNPNWDVNGQALYGIAPLKASLMRLKKNNSAVKAEASSFENEGTKGILHFKVKPGEVDGEMLRSELAIHKQTMISEWSGPENRGRIGLGAYDMGWLPVGLNAEEMQMIESQKWDLRMLCNPFSVQSQLLNDPDNKTYANQEDAWKALICTAVLPALTRRRNSLNWHAHTYWNLPKNQVLDFDMSIFTELAPDIGKVAEGTSKLIAVIPNEQREQSGLAAIDDPLMNEPWVMAGGSRMPMSEYKMQPNEEDLNIDENDES